MRALRYVAVLALAATVVASATAADPREPKKKIIPAVQAKARAINVRLSDLPKAGWRVKPASKDESNPRCSYYDPDQSDLTENGDAESPEFTLADGSSVSSSTSIFQSVAQGRAAYTRVVQPALPKCLAEIFRKGAGAGGAKVKVVSAGPMPFPRLADRSNAYRISASVSVQGRTARVFLDLVLINRGKVDTAIFFAGLGTAFKPGFEQAIATRVAARMARA